MSKSNEFTFEIKKHIGDITAYPNGWKKEVNLVEWNGTAAKLDIRDWEPEHEHMSRGITLKREEGQRLCDILTDFLSGDSHGEDPEMASED